MSRFWFTVNETKDDMAVEEYNELVAALNHSLVGIAPPTEEEVELDEFPTVRTHFNFDI